MSDAVVWLAEWVDAVYRERWTINYAGNAALTFGTEAEARAAAERHGWRVVAAHEQQEGMTS